MVCGVYTLVFICSDVGNNDCATVHADLGLHCSHVIKSLLSGSVTFNA